MAEQFEVKGLSEMAKQLKLLPDAIVKRVLLKALKAHGQIVVDNAKSFVPVGKAEGGHLRDAIKMKPLSKRRTQASRAIQIGVLDDIKSGGLKAATYENARATGLSHRAARRAVFNKTGLTGFANSDFYYWRFVEFGTSKWPGGHPFLVPATISALTNGPSAFSAQLKAGIDKEIAKLPKYNPA